MLENMTFIAKEEKSMSGFKISKDIVTSLVVQGLRFQPPNAGGPGLIPGQGTRSHMPQLSLHVATKRSCMPQ